MTPGVSSQQPKQSQPLGASGLHWSRQLCGWLLYISSQVYGLGENDCPSTEPSVALSQAHSGWGLMVALLVSALGSQ